eukprot:GHRQ01018283.1.p1 GENE.GHRQ01018283.1~~GHRQ01018283.1.p1  ORF type:complete len:143 (+),score=36.47 GHRQ01018283.1:135-563(+)
MAQASAQVAADVTQNSEQSTAAAAAAATYSIHDDVGEVLFSKQQMAEKVAEMGKLLGITYQGKAPVLMPILKGGFIFAADLIRALDPCPEDLVVEFVSARYARTLCPGGLEQMACCCAAAAAAAGATATCAACGWYQHRQHR